MKAIQLAEPKSFRVIDVPEPAEPGAGEAVVKVFRVGVCGTDYSGYLGKMPFFSYPRIPGHELGVEVVAVGPGVTNVKPGDRASVEPYINCQTCYSCARGHTNCCENHQTLGVHIDGGLRPLFTVPGPQAARLDETQLRATRAGRDARHRAARHQPREPAAGRDGAGHRGRADRALGGRVRQARWFARRRDGPERASGCVSPASKMGVRETILAKNLDEDVKTFTELTGGKLGNVVVDATGSVKSMVAALNFVGFAGRLAWVGITQDPLSFTQPLMHRREMTLLASRNALPHEFTRIIRLDRGRHARHPAVDHAPRALRRE